MKWIKSLVVFFFLLYIFFQPNLDNLIYFTSGTCFQDGTSSVYYVLYSGLICFAPKGAVVGCHLEKKKKKSKCIQVLYWNKNKKELLY